MLFPFHHTQPAELISTSALHSITSLVLLDWFLARRTQLSVSSDPGYIISLTLILQVPGLVNHAGCRDVSLVSTLHAYFLIALAFGPRIEMST